MVRRLLKRFLIVALLVGLGGCTQGGSLQGGAELNIRRGTVEYGSIDSIVTAAGTILPADRVSLSFDRTGLVQEVLVEVGDTVEAGQPLARVDSRVLDLSARQAEIALQIQQLSYDQLFIPASPAQIASAQAAVDSAMAAYEKEKEGADPEQVRIAQYQYEQAFNAYIQADMQLRAVQWYTPEDALLPLRAQVNQALLNVESARLQLEQVRSDPDQYALAASWASVSQAQADLARLVEGPTELDILRSQIQVDQAQLALDRARQSLENTVLTSPFAGVITTVNISPGMLPPTGQPAIVVADVSQLHLEVEVDEMDIGQVVPGQPVLIMLDALPSETIEGQVKDISPSANIDRGVVSYTVRVDLAGADLPLRSGMTATAEIIVHRLEDVLLVPNWAIRFDRATGGAFVSILDESGKLQEISVALGLRGAQFSQVLSGLDEGDVVAVSLENESISLFSEEE